MLHCFTVLEIKTKIESVHGRFYKDYFKDRMILKRNGEVLSDGDLVVLQHSQDQFQRFDLEILPIWWS
jgi:hypothetical protein